MKNKICQIGDLKVKITESMCDSLPYNYENFIDEDLLFDFEIVISEDDFSKIPFNITLTLRPFCFGYDGKRVLIGHTSTMKLVAILDKDNKRLELSKNYRTDMPMSIADNFLYIFYMYCLSVSSGFHMHANVLSYKGEGVLFTAISGGGKSTQGKLWHQKYADQIDDVNGDKAIIRKVGEEFRVYGGPWAGTSGIFKNVYVPIRAIIVVEKGGKNGIRKLSLPEAISKISPRIYYPYWDEELTGINMDTLGELLMRVPVYVVTGNPEVEIAELSKKMIFGEE